MRKLLRKPWFVTVLSISAVVLCTWSLQDQLGGSSRAPRRAVTDVPAADPATLADRAPEDDAGETDPGSVPAATTVTQTLSAIVYPEKIPDPFSRRDAQVVAAPEGTDEEAAPLPDIEETVRLTAVWTQGAARLAVINNRILQVGDVIGRLKVDEVNVDGVWMTHWKGRDFVPFGGAFTLVTPATRVASSTLAQHEH
jgi:hypothetical protein